MGKKYCQFTNPHTSREYRVRICHSYKERLLGYMFQKTPEEEALFFAHCNSIHMFGMRFSLSVLFLDQNKTVVRKIDVLKPNRLVPPVKGAVSVMEAPLGTFEAIAEGERIQLDPEESDSMIGAK